MPTLRTYPGRGQGGTGSSGTRVTRDGRQTLSRSHWAVVLVPGIMGSRVEKADGSDRIWDPDRTRFMLWLMTQSPDTLTTLYNHRLTPGRTIEEIYSRRNRSLIVTQGDAQEFTLGLSRTERNWGSIAWDYYGEGAVGIQRQIAAQGGVVWCFGYDWRQSNLTSGEQLRNFVRDTVMPTTRYKPIIVTHSMGGLVTRAACAVHGMESMVSAVIHTMMPTHGATESYGSIKHGRMGFPFRYLVGNTHEEIACVSSGVTGMYELMPSQFYPDRNWLTIDSQLNEHCSPPGPYALSNPYQIYRESNGLVGLVRHETFNANVVNVGANRYVRNTRRVLRHILDNITSAETYHHRRVRDYCHPRTWLIAGDRKDTVQTAELAFHQDNYRGTPLRPEARTTLNESNRGDATVPLVSARALENHRNCQGGYIVNGVVHAESTNERVVYNAIVDLIRESIADGLERQ